jgi:hypothetical protein
VFVFSPRNRRSHEIEGSIRVALLSKEVKESDIDEYVSFVTVANRNLIDVAYRHLYDEIDKD